MKKLFIPLFLCVCAVNLVGAEELRFSDLSKGMVSFPSQNNVPDNAAVYIQNFYTDIDQMVVERNGFTKKESTVLGGTKAVSGLWRFEDANSEEWIIAFSSRTFYKSKSGTAFTTMGVVQTVDTVPSATVNLGKIWFTNQTDNVWWFDGTSTGAVASAPKGRLIGNWRNRIAIANIPSSRSTVRVSQDGDGTSWSIGSNPTDPFAIEIGGANDGDSIQCYFSSYLDFSVIGRGGDLYALNGFDQDDYSVRKISDEVGCIESLSMQELDGALYWLSNRGVERMHNWTIENISEPVRDLADVITKNSSEERSVLLTSKSDWDAGTQTPSDWADTSVFTGDLSNKTTTFVTTSETDLLGGTFTASNYTSNFGFVDSQSALPAGRIETFFPDPFDTFRASSTALNPSTNDRIPGWWNDGGGSSVTSGVLTVNSQVGSQYRVTANTISQLRRGVTLYFEVTDMKDCTGGGGTITDGFSLTSVSPTSGGPRTSLNNNCYYMFERSGTSHQIRGPLNGDSYYTSDASCPSLGTEVSNIGLPFTFTLWVSTSGLTWSVDGATTDGSGSSATGWTGFGNDFVYMMNGVKTAPCGTTSGDFKLTKVGVAPQTFTWSKVFDTAISSPSFDAFDATTIDVSTSITYTVASATSTTGVFGSEVAVVDGGAITERKRALRVTATVDHSSYTGTASSLNDITVNAYSTGTWVSSLASVGSDITSWSIVELTDVDPDDKITYQFGSTSTANVDAITNWQTVNQGDVPSVAVNPYAAFKVLTVPNASTQTVRTQSLKINWNEGDFQPVSSWVFDRRYYMSFSTVSSFNDTTLVWQKNASWTLFKGINAASWATWRDGLYFGNSNDTGYVYRFGDGTSDDGADIISVLTTKSYDFGFGHREKTFKNLYVDYLGDTTFSDSFSVAARVDRTSYIDMGSVYLNEGTGQVMAKLPFSLSTMPQYGRELQLKLSKQGTGDRLRLYDLIISLEPKEAR